MSVRFSKWVAIIVLAITVLFVFSFVLFSNTYFNLLGQKVSYSGVLTASSMFVFAWLPIVSIVYLAEDWRSPSSLVSFTVTPNRVRLYLAKVVVIVLATAVLFALLVVFSFFVGAVRQAEFGDFARFAFFALILALRDVLFASALAILIQSLFLPLVFWFLIPNILAVLRSAALAAFEPSQSNTAAEILSYLDFNIPDFIDSGTVVAHDGTSWLHFLVSVVVWVVIPMTLGFWRLSRRDI